MASFDEEGDAKYSASKNWSYHSAVWGSFTSAKARQEHEKVFRELEPRTPVLAEFGDADGLIAFLRKDNEEYDRKDAIYLSLIHRQQCEPSKGLFSLLVRAMLPALSGVFYSRAKSMTDAVDRDDLCSRVLTGFAETVARYPLENWPHGVAKNLKLNTMTRLRATEATDARQWEALANHLQAAGSLLTELERSNEPEPKSVWDEKMAAEDAPAPPHPEELTELRACLERHVAAGYLAPRDMRLLFDVYGLGRPMADVAAELGITEAAAWKRKERALADIRDKRVRRRRAK